jgi:hypothetical protein
VIINKEINDMSDNTSDDRDKLYAIFKPYIRDGYDEDMRLTIDNGDTYHEILHEIEALIAHKVNEAKIQGGIDEMTRVDPNACYYPTGREPIGSQERLTELKAQSKTDTTEEIL